jgi:electron transfer flavoprotein alpha subunit
MAIIVFAEHDENKFKKSSFEAVSYGKDLAASTGTQCIAVSIGFTDSAALKALSQYGADRIIDIPVGADVKPDSGFYAQALVNAGNQLGGNVYIVSNTYTGKSVAPRIAARTKASIVSGVVSMADTSQGFSVKKSCYSNKAFTYVSLTSENKVLALVPNSYEIKENQTQASPETLTLTLDAPKCCVLSVNREKGKIPLTEAEIVVSAGRGMKGPENWGMIEELASLLNGATACSKPVSDMEWRPHSEHVGQTGITIKPNLYIAVGISGAIQHLAGVGSSKIICVINKDPEAPFFKAADFGIVGDAFEVLPKLIERARQLHHS